MSTVHDARLVPAACVAWIAALVSTSAWRVPAVVVVTVAVLAVAGAIVATRTRSRLAGSGALLCGVAASIMLVATAQGASGSAQAAALIAEERTDAWIVVTGQAAPMPGWDGQPRYRVAAAVTAVRPQCREPPACAPWTAMDVPVTVVLEARPSRGENLQVQASWKASALAPARAVAWEARVEAVAAPSVLVQWRDRFESATSALGDSSRGLVRGMVVGDTSAMAPSQVQDMRVAGLAHLTAVSGAHFAILIMACSGALAAARAPRALRALAILAVAGTFAMLVGAESSVLRALGMATAVGLATAWGRPARGMAALAVTVVLLLVWEPALARALGFAMSVLAVAAIVLWSPRIAAALAHVVTPGLARLAAIPIAAQIAVTPVLVIIEPRLGPYAVAANLLAGLAVLPTMLAGALTLGLSAVSVPAATLVAHLAGACASAIAAVARAAAQAPGSWLAWPAGAAGVIMALTAGLVLIASTTAVHPSRRVAALVTAVALSGAGLSWAGESVRPAMSDWDIAACDVGQGDMLLLRASPHAAVVIDTGPPGGGASTCLERHGITEVPLLILTHPHQDHDGAVVSVLRAAAVEAAWVSAAGAGGAASRALAGAGVSVEVPAAGRTERRGQVSLTVMSQAHARPGVEGNDASIVIHGAAGDTSLLALGDLEESGQRELLALLTRQVRVDVVKVAHHGSADQLPALAARIDAAVAVVTVGRDNRHGHPTDAALALYGDRAHAVLRTDQCGDVQVATVAVGVTWSRCPTDVAR